MTSRQSLTRCTLRCLRLLALPAALGWLPPEESWAGVEWIRQFGTTSHEGGIGVSADGLGNVYTTGLTLGSLGGPIAGQADVFVAKYDASGSQLWTRQFGGTGWDQSFGISADKLGSVYITGYQVNTQNAFLTKYDAAGNQLWMKQVGTTNAGEVGWGVSADGLGNVYVAGATGGSFGATNAGGDDVFLSKFDSAGNMLWVKQLGSAGFDTALGVSADGLGNVFVGGDTTGALSGLNAGANDAFVAKYDAAGNWYWTKQVGTSLIERSHAISADGLGGVYVSGRTEGSLAGPNLGLEDAYLYKYDSAGNVAWSTQFGTSAKDQSFGVSADGLGDLYVAGVTSGNIGGPNAGADDAFVVKYDAAGNVLWSDQIGSLSGDIAFAASADGLGKIYIAGYTYGDLQGLNLGPSDAFVAKFPIPEPSGGALSVAALGLAALIWRAKSRRSEIARRYVP